MEESENLQEPEEKLSAGSFLWELVKIVIIAAIIIVPIRFVIAQPFL